MFKKTKDQTLQINEEHISTVIGEGYVFTGEIQGSSVIRIEGKVTGNVTVEAGIVLGEKGIIEGDIKTKSAIIYGTVHGHVHATQLEIKSSGNIHGDITTDMLEIEMGAVYNGKLNMQRPKLAEAS